MYDTYMSTHDNTAKLRAIHSNIQTALSIVSLWLGTNLQCISQHTTESALYALCQRFGNILEILEECTKISFPCASLRTMSTYLIRSKLQSSWPTTMRPLVAMAHIFLFFDLSGNGWGTTSASVHLEFFHKMAPFLILRYEDFYPLVSFLHVGRIKSHTL